MSNAAQERAEAALLPEDDVIGILLSQHARIRDLFTDVHRAQGEAKRAKFDELRALLAVHETAEEMILRPVAEKEAGEKEADARNEEEAEANRALAELERLDIAGPRFEAKLGELERAVGEHAGREEHEEFPPLRAGCSAEQLRSMGRRLLTAEKAAPTHPHPAAAGSPAAQWAVGPFASLLDRARDALSSPSEGLMGTGPASLGREDR
ncbi:hemerythrin domain-containing protein [Streptomyces sp. WMMB 322]|uniref:hemerythrin domain-containing protein n=1 Tax=Streptomyces sp. WMMB 322 TaxID=1286821 RepID=UPI0006E18244|nr:hemerythrin domain-containing protein [Streptomyces sp. WMMB 322]SCK12842.1 Hemerythrin HHE cation binding domain-containing protein [Streptomyces sp. WMMB 322]